MVKALIFDIGGVLAFDVWENLLLDSERGIASNYNLNSINVKKIGKKLWDKFAYSSHDNLLEVDNDWQQLEKVYWNSFVDELNLSVSIDDLIEMTDDFIQPVEGMVDLVNVLCEHDIKLAICSNNTEFWFQRQVNKIGYVDFFAPSSIILSNRIGASKSSNNFEMFKAVLDSLNLDKESCLFIDDRSHHIKQASRFGLPAILFPSHSSCGHKYLKLLFKEMNIF